MFTVAEVAKRLRVSAGAIYGAVQSGRLKAYRIGARGRGTIRISEEYLREYLSGCTGTSPDASRQPTKKFEHLKL